MHNVGEVFQRADLCDSVVREVNFGDILYLVKVFAKRIKLLRRNNEVLILKVLSVSGHVEVSKESEDDSCFEHELCWGYLLRHLLFLFEFE